MERDRNFSWHSGEDDYRELLDQYPQGELQREDLVARRFDRVFTTRCWNP